MLPPRLSLVQLQPWRRSSRSSRKALSPLPRPFGMPGSRTTVKVGCNPTSINNAMAIVVILCVCVSAPYHVAAGRMSRVPTLPGFGALRSRSPTLPCKIRGNGPDVSHRGESSQPTLLASSGLFPSTAGRRVNWFCQSGFSNESIPETTRE
ncbi:hypothetical protein F5B21DRAFT_312974 [Xylaria acuta]|nr:hypothetical protein F5B21DRAFT_312974 [Xylaria acuta]